MTAYKSNNKSYHIQSNSCKRDFKYSGTSVYVYVSREITQYSYCYLHILEVIQCELIKFNDNAMMVKFLMKIWFCDYFWFLSKSDLDSSFSNSIWHLQLALPCLCNYERQRNKLLYHTLFLLFLMVKWHFRYQFGIYFSIQIYKCILPPEEPLLMKSWTSLVLAK